jgi:hypothetical protein
LNAQLEQPHTQRQKFKNCRLKRKKVIAGLEAFEQVMALTPEEVQGVTVCDREADFYEMFVMAAEKHADLLVRANTDRRLR